MIYPLFKDLSTYLKDYKTIPISATVPTGGKLPTEVFRILKNHSRHAYILESLEDTGERGRYTFLGYDPKLCVSCTDGVLSINGGAELKFETDSPRKYIEQIIADNKSPFFEELPPFTGGLVGYFSYDYIKYAEPTLKLDAHDEEGFKDVDLMLFDKVIAFDHLKKEIALIVNMKTDAPKENYNRAVCEIESLERLIFEGTPAEMPKLVLKSGFSHLFDEAEYCAMVEKAKHRIREGDIFQVVLANRLSAEADGSLFGTYLTLRETNPSPYMFYFSSDDLEIAGASPETLVKLKHGELFTFPLAGTRPRGKTREEDEELERGLLNDPKELSEHNMLVDLGRNDIGKISKFGTVAVKKYLSVLRFSHVMHIGSTVRGEIRDGLGALDAIDAVLPAGTLSGAPKLRAMEIINELEGHKRGIYGGAIGYIGFSGNADTCIAIRIAFKKNGKVFVRSGAGIVADSVAESEFRECENKAGAVVRAIERESNVES
ncbi:MAG: anthranilate synthase component I family protein [Clostridiales bacterium]|jgi:anthranilate synthase component 1|nr:anthranilate synthase component I family protein [Clostridiales bacterium]